MGTEEFWKGDFGNEYTARNVGRIALNERFFKTALKSIHRFIGSVVELGAGSGENLAAINNISPTTDLCGVEINEQAYEILSDRLKERHGWADCTTYNESLLEWQPPRKYDLAFTKGVLIHIAPEDLPAAYDKLYQAGKHILIAEYFSPEPREIPYRGHEGKLWTRDYGGEMLDRHKDLKLLDVGFHYNRLTGQDNITHWLMVKR